MRIQPVPCKAGVVVTLGARFEIPEQYRVSGDCAGWYARPSPVAGALRQFAARGEEMKTILG